MLKIIYLHGFSSSPNSLKAEKFKNAFCGYNFFIADYPAHQPARAIDLLTKCIVSHSKSNTSLVLIGSSLGGYYAQYLGSMLDEVKKVVLINPALQPKSTLAPYLGMHKNMASGELFNFLYCDLLQLVRFDVASMRKIKDTLVLLDQGDDIIDFRFAENRYKDIGRVICYPGGSHWFDHLDVAIPEIKLFINS